MSASQPRESTAAQTSVARAGTTTSVQVPADQVVLEGTLRIPTDARGIVVFAHGSGSSRHSPRNVLVAEELHGHGLATLLFDLLIPAEEAYDQQTRALRFDIPFLATRLEAAVRWLHARPETRTLPTGLFGASTGAAAALVAAAHLPGRVHAVVSRGGRVDLAGEAALIQNKAPVLLIVGEHDPVVGDLNKLAAERVSAPHEIVVVPRATHLFEEPGALEEVARLAGAWFDRYLPAAGDLRRR